MTTQPPPAWPPGTGPEPCCTTAGSSSLTGAIWSGAQTSTVAVAALRDHYVESTHA